MTNHNTTQPTISRVKQRAKKLKKECNISHSEALLLISNEHGFSDWKSFQEELKNNEQAKAPTPQPSITFVEYDDVEMSDDDYKMLDQEREAELAEGIKKRVANNKRQLTKLGIEFSVFEPTITGLKKSILDATQQVRVHFELEGFHYYWEQGQGPEYKVMKDAYLLSDDEVTKSKASLYRPKTKQGDPRIWFRKLPSYSTPGDQVAIIIKDDATYLINLSIVVIEESLSNDKSHIKTFLESFVTQHNTIAKELLDKLKELAKSPFSALRIGDTAIGFTLEEKLGIAANSSKLPDYKGIELKSGRGNKTRTTLFAQVADWSISPCKKSAEILNKYGYERDDDFKLYCTITTQRENPQGLSFIYDQTKDQLQEWYNKTDLVAVWPGALLRKRLKEKHAETFWVEAKSEVVNGVEQFQLLKVTHTKSPILSQLLPLIQSGVVTMDHLIKRNGQNNRVSEKGPLFKINKRDLELLFPKPITYSLI
ncbi:MvaI/BcnI family restriction endonuclease [Psychromonas sp. SP041]|uniref:MvaI/BcnI family restriction endonuclease n=1 Tax=Psychromonas sp. SP041 TaxID=1365007 RepID=UPI00040BFC2C|nr:MvaI/BcnI family restriction endonuclease [Psychromonas sp. SP041]